MKIEGKLLEKLTAAGIEIEEAEREYLNEDGEMEIVHYEIAKFPRARDFVPIRFNGRIEDDILLESDFQHFKFIKDFEAIWSPKNNVIECELLPVHRNIMPSRFLIKRIAKLFDEELEDGEEYKRFEFEKSEEGITISIGTASQEYAVLSYLKDKGPRYEYALRKPTLRIENFDISTHDKAKRTLEKIGNSILFKMDVSANIGFKLAEDREIRRSYFRRKKTEFELDVAFPTYEYDKEPMSLYWYAKSAREMPLLQFLALYQILEFYFPIFSQKDAHQQIKNLLKDPRFNPNKDSDITKVLSAISLNKSQMGFGSELEQLKSTIGSCITNEDLRELFESDQEMIDFFNDNKSKKLSSKKLNIDNVSSDLVLECAERIYEIRCRVVHTKASDKNFDLLLPSSPELKYLVYDISILEVIAKKVLVSTSRLMKI
ncbi:MAG: hypothetical protein JXR11_13910 [Balneola sp.]